MSVTISKLSYQLLVDSSDLEKGLVASRKEINYAKRAMRELKTPLEAYEAEVAKASSLLKLGAAGQELYNRKLEKAEKRLKSETRAAKMQTKAYKALAHAKRLAIGAATAAGAIAVGTAYMVARQVSSDLEEIDKVAKAARALAISTEELTSLQYTFELGSGIASEQTTKALEKMIRRTSEAAAGTGEAKASIDELGLSAEKLNKMTPDKMLREYADAFADVTSESDKLRLATKIFDDESAKMFTTLDKGGAHLDKMAQRAKALGLTFSSIDAANVEAANDAMRELELSMAGLSRALTVEIAPALKSLVNELSDSIGGPRGTGGYAQGGVNVATGLLRTAKQTTMRDMFTPGSFMKNYLGNVQNLANEQEEDRQKIANESIKKKAQQQMAQRRKEEDDAKAEALAVEQDRFNSDMGRMFNWMSDGVNGFVESMPKPAEVASRTAQRFDPLDAVAAGSRAEFDIVNRSITIQNKEVKIAERTAMASERSVGLLEELLEFGGVSLRETNL